MKTREFFNKNQQRENPTVQRMPPPIESVVDNAGYTGEDLMAMLEDGQVMWAGRVETITRQKLPRAWPKENL